MRHILVLYHFILQTYLTCLELFYHVLRWNFKPNKMKSALNLILVTLLVFTAAVAARWWRGRELVRWFCAQGFLVWPPIKRDDFLLVRCRRFTRDGASHPIKANSQAIGVRSWFHFNHLIVLLDLIFLTVSVPSRVYRPTHVTSWTNWRLWWGQSNV